MPTGYTYGVADGTVTDLKTFALICARGMGALVTMRDEPYDAPIPERFEPSDYHSRELAAATERLGVLKTMSNEAIAAEAAAWNTANDLRRLERVRENDAQRERYDRMIAQVEAWQGAPEGLKEFMLGQLRHSRDFDVSDEPLKYCEPPRSAAEWHQEELRRALCHIEYHEKEDAEERRRTDARNAWLRQLHDSLNRA